MKNPIVPTRREFVSATLLGLAAASTNTISSARETEKPKYRICAFEKFLQDLSFDELADAIAELGFVGIEATVRNKGHVLPERVEEDLPKMVEALKKTQSRSHNDGD